MHSKLKGIVSILEPRKTINILRNYWLITIKLTFVCYLECLVLLAVDISRTNTKVYQHHLPKSIQNIHVKSYNTWLYLQKLFSLPFKYKYKFEFLGFSNEVGESSAKWDGVAKLQSFLNSSFEEQERNYWHESKRTLCRQSWT